MHARAPLLVVLLAARALTASAFLPPADLALLGGPRLGALGHGGTAGRRDAPMGPVMMHHESRRAVLRSGLFVPVAGASGLWRVESGEWKVESGEWRVESGEWRVFQG